MINYSSSSRKQCQIQFSRAVDRSPVDFKTYAHPVDVEVNLPVSAARWLKEYGPLTGVTIPVLAAALWAVVRRIRQQRATESSTSPEASPPQQSSTDRS
jgi:hypothetical protein